MLKQTSLALVASFIFVLFASEFAWATRYITVWHHYLIVFLHNIFGKTDIGHLIRDGLALFLVPFIIALIPTLIYRLVAGDFKFKYFSPILWASWLILALITLH
jgi:hypothetical protein